MVNKRIIFFDGDGTIWYPLKTKYNEKPHWIYRLSGGHKQHAAHLILTPTALVTLTRLKKRGIITVLLSTHPHQSKEADEVVNHKVKHFKLEKLFDECYATRLYPQSKSEFILRILKRRKIPKKRAIMVGDSYEWDYKPARQIGVDALLIESNYRKKHLIGKRIKRTIKKLKDVFNYL